MTWKSFPKFESSNVAEIRYDDETQTLEVSFHNGGTYHYYDVHSTIALEFEIAESKGKFLAQRIKGYYRYSRV